jgi:hypothetical protein
MVASERNPLSFFWRATSAICRRTGNLFNYVGNEAYSRSLPGLTSEERRIISSNERFRNYHAGKRCFVIGNGPSLLKQDLSLLANETTFVMNAFCKHPILKQWQPTYYFFSDPVLFDGSDSASEFFASLKYSIHNTTFFAPVGHKEIIEKKGILPPNSTSFFAAARRVLGEDSNNDIDFTRLVPSAETIAQTAIMAAIYMGCSPIYLLGLDHDWLAHRGETGYNFYPGLILKNHPKVTGTLGDYGRQMESLLRVWKTYERLQLIVKKKNIEIKNATHGGVLDLFERVSYESLFNK